LHRAGQGLHSARPPSYTPRTFQTRENLNFRAVGGWSGCERHAAAPAHDCAAAWQVRAVGTLRTGQHSGRRAARWDVGRRTRRGIHGRVPIRVPCRSPCCVCASRPRLLALARRHRPGCSDACAPLGCGARATRVHRAVALVACPNTGGRQAGRLAARRLRSICAAADDARGSARIPDHRRCAAHRARRRRGAAARAIGAALRGPTARTRDGGAASGGDAPAVWRRRGRFRTRHRG